MQLAATPLLTTILNLFIPPSHTRKYRSPATHEKWRIWAVFYQSWIVDTFLRSRAPKSIMRTTMILSVYFLLANLSEPCWRLLMRLKIIFSKATVEKWIKLHPKTVSTSADSVLVFVFDNCSFRLHVAHTRSDHRSSFIHVINQYIAELPHRCMVQAGSLWREVSVNDFGKLIQPSPVDSENFARKCWQAFEARPEEMPLRFLYNTHQSNVRKTDLTILEPHVGLETLTYRDIKIVVDKFFEDYLQHSPRTIAFVSGDQQVWIKLFYLRTEEPQKYGWMIPVPGEWHWLWHILKGIFRLYYDTILLPFSKMLGFSSLDKEANNFHYAEDFLQMVTVAIFKWIQACFALFNNPPPGYDVIDWLEEILENRIAYELVYACYYYFIPYWVTRYDFLALMEIDTMAT